MDKKITVTVGIPAYNESANIKNLLKDLVQQDQKNFVLQKIIVSSDGSTDKTIDEARKVHSKKIVVLDNKTRRGQAYRQNQIIKLTNSDILVLLNADILLADRRFIFKLIKPIVEGKADVVSSNLLPLRPKTFFEKVLYAGYLLKNDIFEAYREGDNVYTCHGAARAFSKKFYRSLNFTDSVGEDAYTYFLSKKLSMTYIYSKKARVFMRLPQNVKDHSGRSIRFFHSKERMIREFEKNLTEHEYKIPLRYILKSALRHFFIHPLGLTLYFIVVFYFYTRSFYAKPEGNLWRISMSSKTLID